MSESEIEHQRDSNWRWLVAEWDRLKASHADIANRLAEVEAEKEALATAINAIAFEPLGHPEASHRECLDTCVEIARAALAAAKGDGT